MNVEQRLTTLLDEAAKNLQLSNYTINLTLNAEKGDGFLGEFYKVSITDNDTEEEIKLAVKKAPEGEIMRKEIAIDLCYRNEIAFYSVIYPALKKFEEEHQVSEPFDSIPQYIASVGDLGKEMIVFKDITYARFEMREKDLLLDDEHASFIFKAYGHFHAISFCLKDQKPEEFTKLTQPLGSFWANAMERDGFIKHIATVITDGYETLDQDQDAPIKEKFQKYVNNTEEEFAKALNYQGDYSGLLHGDCWSNNMMFKYQNNNSKSKLEKMNLLDFQLAIVGTPVFDLAYFFYTGGSKTLFAKLEHYLDIYHESFSKSVKNLGGDPETLFPREALSKDWNKYAKLGMILSLMLVKVKLTSKEETIGKIDKLNKGETDQDQYQAPYNRTLFRERVRDIIYHVYEIDAL